MPDKVCRTAILFRDSKNCGVLGSQKNMQKKTTGRTPNTKGTVSRDNVAPPTYPRIMPMLKLIDIEELSRPLTLQASKNVLLIKY